MFQVSKTSSVPVRIYDTWSHGSDFDPACGIIKKVS